MPVVEGPSTNKKLPLTQVGPSISLCHIMHEAVNLSSGINRDFLNRGRSPLPALIAQVKKDSRPFLFTNDYNSDRADYYFNISNKLVPPNRN